MTYPIFLAVMAAAMLHATWNALVKTGENKQTAMAILTVMQSLVGIVVVCFRPWPEAEVWPWLIASGLIHMCYQLFLAYAYEQGDLSRVYPIARGAAPMMVLAFSLVFLTDPIAMMDYVGIVVLGLGIALMARGVFANNESRGLLPFAFGSACATAGYTLVDGLGARVSGDPIGFTGWLLIMAALFYIPSVVALKGRCVLRASVRTWAVIGIAGVASYLAYAIVVWAMTQAPIALVAALRETSILFAVLIGWLVFGEKMDRGKAIASVLIVVGALLTRL